VKTPWFFVVPADMPRLPAVAFARLAEAATRGDAAVGGDTGPGGDVAATDDTTGDDNADRAAAVDETAAGPGARAVLPVAYFPVMGGRRGHPVLISSRVIPELLSHGGEYPSMGAFLRRYPVGEVQIDDEGIFVDVDTPEDFAAITPPRADD
jgi:CTP:molybdopterin cytidylyltransferase MocA